MFTLALIVVLPCKYLKPLLLSWMESFNHHVHLLLFTLSTSYVQRF